MTGRRIAGTALLGSVGFVLALVVAGAANGLALLAYVLFVCALALLVLVARLRTALPAAPAFDRLLAVTPRPETPVEQYQRIERWLAFAESSAIDLHYRLRPLVREIVTARLSRRHGVDPDRSPDRARALLADGRAWELARPDRQLPEDRHGRGWSRQELEALLEELEEL